MSGEAPGFTEWERLKEVKKSKELVEMVANLWEE